MQDEIIDYFIQLTKIPHCSKNADGLLEFIKDFAIKRDYCVEVDKAKNILVKKGNPKLALQAHYDMVCIGKAPNIETYIKDGWMYAKESSLGADNGIAIAMMMFLMDKGLELEFLFTSDEEIGLIGATNLDLKLESKYMLNIDSEDEAEVYIGCAGGIDIFATKEDFEKIESYRYIYEISVSNLAGGHSGVDIDKNIPNAIKVLGDFLFENKIYAISSFEGGERTNSIPTNAKAIITTDEIIESSNLIKVSRIDSNLDFYNGKDFINFIHEFKHGVYEYNNELNIPNNSANLAIVEFRDGKAKIEVSLRGMSKESLNEILDKSLKLFQKYGFNTKERDKYPSWKPEINKFSEVVYKSILKIFGKSEYRAIHAGLECGIISQKYPNIKIASIGPNIKYPHSIREKVEIESIYKTFKAIEDIIDNIN
jgi:dipeptidase D